MTDSKQDAEDELSVLTEKQREVLILAAKGFTVYQCSKHLGIKSETVLFHRGEMKKALGGVTTIEAAVLAAKAGWV